MLELAEQGSYVVLAGGFNPAIFNPDWLARQGVVTHTEADGAKIEVVTGEIAKFEVGNLTFDVRQDRIMISAQMEPFVRLADVVGMLFVERLRYTPIKALGINYYVHAIMPSWESRVRFGRALAPIEPWGEMASSFESDDKDGIGGMVDLTMQAERKDGRRGVIRTTIQPSVKVDDHRGVFIQVNDHFYDPELDPDAKEQKTLSRHDRRRAAKATRLRRPSTPTIGDKASIPDVNYAQFCVEEFSPSIARSRHIVANLVAVAESI
jgi:hypothetical protein